MDVSKYNELIGKMDTFYDNNKAIISEYLTLQKEARTEGDRMCKAMEKENDYTFTVSLTNVKGFSGYDIVNKICKSLEDVGCWIGIAPEF